MHRLALVLIVAMVGWSARADPPSGSARRPDVSMPLEGTVTNPDWVRRPTGEEMSNFYPRVAQLVGLDGHVTIECGVTAEGGVENCAVLSETPVGMEFGKAAVAMADLFRMKPKTIDGAPVAGAKVIIPIGFMYPHVDADDPPPPSPVGEAPSPKALMLAKQVVADGFTSDAINAYLAKTRDNISRQFAATSLTEQEQSAVDEFMLALQAAMPTINDWRAERIARRMPESELAQLDAFMASPTGRDWMKITNSESSESGADFARTWAAVRLGARTQFCQKFACTPRPAAPAATKP
jgi:TonB family protein